MMIGTFYKIFLVGLGGFVGSVCRFLAAGFVQEASGTVNFPYGTIAVNLIGCLVIGFLSYLADAQEMFSTDARAFIFVGVLGGFTTFSTFGNETLNLVRHGSTAYAIVNVAVQVIFGLALVWAGRSAAQLIWG
jgi:CrcB protein